ncbi:MAG: hypothetical protein KIS85_02015 [Anaerolineales bacterium]|nr:hypothetical protein [Anaerolineales bacterium]
MTLFDEIQEQVRKLPRDKQKQVLAFAKTLGQIQPKMPAKGSLKQHPVFGSWAGRNIDALEYQKALRTEWDHRS